MKALTLLALLLGSSFAQALQLECDVYGASTETKQIIVKSTGEPQMKVEQIGNYSFNVQSGPYGTANDRAVVSIMNVKTGAAAVGEGFGFVSTALIESQANDTVSATCLFVK